MRGSRAAGRGGTWQFRLAGTTGTLVSSVTVAGPTGDGKPATVTGL